MPQVVWICCAMIVEKRKCVSLFQNSVSQESPNLHLKKKQKKKQVQRRAAAETASRKLIKHFIHLMHNS